MQTWTVEQQDIIGKDTQLDAMNADQETGKFTMEVLVYQKEGSQKSGFDIGCGW